MSNGWLVALGVLLAAGADARTVCRFSAPGALSFGSYDTESALPRDSQADVRVTCARDGGPPNIDLTVAIGPSSGGGSGSARSLVGPGTAILAYGLYRDSGRTLPWGDSPGTNTESRTASIPNKSSSTVTFTVYGRIAARQLVRAGTYMDTLQVTLAP